MLNTEEKAATSGVKNNASTAAAVNGPANPTVDATSSSPPIVVGGGDRVGGGGVVGNEQALTLAGAATAQTSRLISTSRSPQPKPFEYKNGRKIEQLMFSYESYFKHKEKIPKRFYPLVQYLENVEVKYHNDNLFEDTPLGFPTRAQLDYYLSLF